jgi:histidine triad (HIT) family protein
MPIEIPHPERCAFCRYIEGQGEAAVVEDLADTLAFLNPRQYGIGAMLVIPKRHAPTVLDLDPIEAAAVMRHVHRLAQAVTRAFDPSGINIFQNNGISAGQTVAHYHVHVVPRYPGDPGDKVFHADEFERTSIEERLQIAARIIPHLPPLA